MYRQWAQADKDYRTLSYIFVGGIAAPVAAAGLVETGSTYYLYQGGSWLVRNYGANFALETFKEWAAQRGSIKSMDWSDVLVSTATSKFSFWGKVAGEIFNATNDVTIGAGWQNSFMSKTGPYNKRLGTTLIDGGFGILQLSTGDGVLKDFNIDQAKYELNKYVDPPR